MTTVQRLPLLEFQILSLNSELIENSILFSKTKTIICFKTCAIKWVDVGSCPEKIRLEYQLFFMHAVLNIHHLFLEIVFLTIVFFVRC